MEKFKTILKNKQLQRKLFKNWNKMEQLVILKLMLEIKREIIANAQYFDHSFSYSIHIIKKIFIFTFYFY